MRVQLCVILLCMKICIKRTEHLRLVSLRFDKRLSGIIGSVCGWMNMVGEPVARNFG